jgi:hypothetical protein
MQVETVSERRNVLYESQFALVNFSVETVRTRMNAGFALFLVELATHLAVMRPNRYSHRDHVCEC